MIYARSSLNEKKKCAFSHSGCFWTWALEEDALDPKCHPDTNSFFNFFLKFLIQFSSVTQSCLTLCDPMVCSTPGLPVHHQFLEFTQTHVHWVSDAIQPLHPLSFPSPPAFNLFQHQGLFKRVRSSHQMAKVFEFQLQHQSFQWTLRTVFSQFLEKT